jgi:hypothetical protein
MAPEFCVPSRHATALQPGQHHWREHPHPPWCSLDHCRADRIGKSHESAPVRVGDLTLTVSQSATPDCRTHAVLVIESEPTEGGNFLVLRLGEVPDVARALLEVFTRT